MTDFPLAGLKVLDFSRVVAGPYATRMLSDLGAEVLKVEPPEGDVTRKLAKRENGVSGNYLQLNIGKKNICVDLKAEGARAGSETGSRGRYRYREFPPRYHGQIRYRLG